MAGPERGYGRGCASHGRGDHQRGKHERLVDIVGRVVPSGKYSFPLVHCGTKFTFASLRICPLRCDISLAAEIQITSFEEESQGWLEDAKLGNLIVRVEAKSTDKGR